MLAMGALAPLCLSFPRWPALACCLAAALASGGAPAWQAHPGLSHPARPLVRHAPGHCKHPHASSFPALRAGPFSHPCSACLPTSPLSPRLPMRLLPLHPNSLCPSPAGHHQQRQLLAVRAVPRDAGHPAGHHPHVGAPSPPPRCLLPGPRMAPPSCHFVPRACTQHPARCEPLLAGDTAASPGKPAPSASVAKRCAPPPALQPARPHRVDLPAPHGRPRPAGGAPWPAPSSSWDETQLACWQGAELGCCSGRPRFACWARPSLHS